MSPILPVINAQEICNQDEVDNYMTPEATPAWNRLCPWIDHCEAHIRYINQLEQSRNMELITEYLCNMLSEDFEVDAPMLGYEAPMSMEQVMDYHRRWYVAMPEFHSEIQAIIPENVEGTKLTVLTRFSGIQIQQYLMGMPLNKPFSVNMRETLTIERDRFKNSFVFKKSQSQYSGDLNDMAAEVRSCCLLDPHDHEAAIAALSGPHIDAALAVIAPKAWELASSCLAGSQVVQRALERADAATCEVIAGCLRSHVVEAATSSTANAVLQKCIEIVPPSHILFVLEELLGHVSVVAKNRFGHRVLERCLLHFLPGQFDLLEDEVLDCALELSKHHLGNFVIQHVLEHGTRTQQAAITTVLLSDDISQLARHRMGRHVVTCALGHCSTEERKLLLEGLQPSYEKLLQHHCGSFVAREMRRYLSRKASHRK
jgi:hypothetical protein